MKNNELNEALANQFKAKKKSEKDNTNDPQQK